MARRDGCDSVPDVAIPYTITVVAGSEALHLEDVINGEPVLVLGRTMERERTARIGGRFRAAPPIRRDAPRFADQVWKRCFSRGTTQVPLARHTTIGSSSTSQAESLPGSGRITLRASKRIFREVLPTSTISPSASM